MPAQEAVDVNNRKRVISLIDSLFSDVTMLFPDRTYRKSLTHRQYTDYHSHRTNFKRNLQESRTIHHRAICAHPASSLTLSIIIRMMMSGMIYLRSLDYRRVLYLKFFTDNHYSRTKINPFSHTRADSVQISIKFYNDQVKSDKLIICSIC